MVGDDTTLREHLHKLVGLESEQELENLLKLLWQTRKTGLLAAHKSSLQTLLKFPSPGDLDPVLASLRSLMRNCVRNNLEGDDILKLLPPNLPVELQSMLLLLLQKHQSQWKGEMSQEQHVPDGNISLHQLNAGPSAPVLNFPSSGSLLSPQVDPSPQFNSRNCAGPVPATTQRNVFCCPQLTPQNDSVPHEILSMTWTVDNKSAIPANRVATITLKLHDCTKCHSNETEVRFQLTRDVLEAVLRSMIYINEQLSRSVRSSSGPLQKKQRQ